MKPRTAHNQHYSLARSASACLGIALLIWALAPAILLRLTSSSPPPFSAIAMNSTVFLLGGLFIGLQQMMARRLPWAVWTALAFSLLLTGVVVVSAALSGFAIAPLFLLLLAGSTVVACWVCVIQIHGHQDSGQA